MNIVTRALLEQVRDEALEGFIQSWDRLEELVIRVYKRGRVTEEDQAEFNELRAILQASYPDLAPSLEPAWRKALVGGEPAREDPFLFLISTQDAFGFIDHWKAMQTLPAAREAINTYLIEKIERKA